jgi:hypothetical protein
LVKPKKSSKSNLIQDRETIQDREPKNDKLEKKDQTEKLDIKPDKKVKNILSDSGESQDAKYLVEDSQEDKDDEYSDDSEASEENETSTEDDDFKLKFKKKIPTTKKKSPNEKIKNKSKKNEKNKEEIISASLKRTPINNKTLSEESMMNKTESETYNVTESNLDSYTKNDAKKLESTADSMHFQPATKIEPKPVLKSSENFSMTSITPKINSSSSLTKPFTSVLTTSAASATPLGKIDIKTHVPVRVGLSRNSKVKPLHPNVKPI